MGSTGTEAKRRLEQVRRCVEVLAPDKGLSIFRGLRDQRKLKRLAEDWLRCANLSGRARQEPRLSPQNWAALSMALVSPDNTGLLEKVLRTFFVEAHPELNNLFLKHAPQEARGKAPEYAEKAMRLVRTTYPQDPFLDLFEATIRCFEPEWFSSDQEKPPEPVHPVRRHMDA